MVPVNRIYYVVLRLVQVIGVQEHSEDWNDVCNDVIFTFDFRTTGRISLTLQIT
jgi:hypothetical protein